MISLKRTLARYLTLCILLAQASTLLAAPVQKPEALAGPASRMMAGTENGSVTVDGNTLYAAQIAYQMLELNDFQPVWDAAKAEVLKSAVAGLILDGLRPADYWFPEADILVENQQLLSPSERVRLDFLLTETFARAVYNLKFGKVDPVSLDKNINFTEQIASRDIAPVLLKYIVTGTIASALQRTRPQQPQYEIIRQTLARYRAYQKAGGWPTIDPGPPLKPGDRGPRVSQMRERLAATGDFSGQTSPTDVFDRQLQLAVQSFQQQHGLEADTIAGPQTLHELNIPVEQRINALRVGLERLRWYLHQAKGEFIVADIAGFQLYWVRDNTTIWEDKIQVGASYTRTPIFKDTIRYLVLNPTWTIPPGILKRTILPNLKKNPGYLDEKGYQLLDKDGTRLDARAIDWQALQSIPYRVQQPPGPSNALGRIKFMFPNPHHVYLHDTNHRELFVQARRTFSSGCIRVQHPFDFAEKLLQNQDGWDRKRIEQAVASGQTEAIRLHTPIRVIIAYGTTAVREGKVHFRADVYQRDQAVLKALDGTFRLRQQDMPVASTVPGKAGSAFARLHQTLAVTK